MATFFQRDQPMLEMMKEWKNNPESDEESTTDQRDSRFWTRGAESLQNPAEMSLMP